MNPALIIVAALALLLFGAGALLWTSAQGREQRDALLLRARVTGGKDDAVLPTVDTAPELDLPLVRWASQLLWRAGYEVKPRSVLLGLVSVIVLAVLLFLIGGLLGGLLIDGGLLVLLYGVLNRQAARRRTKIIEQLPGFLENVIRIMSAGNSLEESFATAALENPDPVRPLFLSVGRQVKLGAQMDQALADAGALYRIRDLRVMALAATVNRRYGGSMRGVLRSLITAIRQRGIAARELRALTAETRFSALVWVVIPVGLSIFIFLRNRLYYQAMLHDPLDKYILYGSAILQVLGAFVLWRMLNSTEDAEA